MTVMSITEVNEAAGRTKTREASTPLLRGPEHSMRAREPRTEEEAVAKARAHALMAGPPRWDGEDVAAHVKAAVCQARREWQAPQDLREASLLTTAGADAPPATAPEPPPCLLYTSPSPRDGLLSRMPSSA